MFLGTCGCSKIEVFYEENQIKSGDIDRELLGIYRRVDNKKNDRFYYKKEDYKRSVWIWWESNKWNIGSNDNHNNPLDVSGRKLMAYTLEESMCPQSQTSKKWLVPVTGIYFLKALYHF